MSTRRPRLVLFAVGLALALLRDPAVAQCPDVDRDALCDENDPCANTAGIEVVDPFLRLRKVAPPASRIKFVGRLVVPTSPPIDPSRTGLRLAIRDGNGTVTIDAILPGGAFDPSTERGWATNSTGTVHYYRDPHGLVAGIMRAVVKRLTPDGGDLKVVLFGQGGVYPLPEPPATATVVIDGPMSTDGQCGDGTLSDCRFRNQGDKLLCRGPRLDP
jgi:hypothetical protein